MRCVLLSVICITAAAGCTNFWKYEVGDCDTASDCPWAEPGKTMLCTKDFYCVECAELPEGFDDRHARTWLADALVDFCDGEIQ